MKRLRMMTYWEIKNETGNITLKEIEHFGNYQMMCIRFIDSENFVCIDDDCLPEHLKGNFEIYPWYNFEAGHALTNAQAEEYFSKKGVDNFIKNTRAYLKKHRFIKEASIITSRDDDKGKDLKETPMDWHISMFRNNNDDGTVTYSFGWHDDEIPEGSFDKETADKIFRELVDKHSMGLADPL